MNISNYYWYFSGVLTPRFCDEVIQYANAQKEAHTFNGILKFDIKLFSQVLDFSWVSPRLFKPVVILYKRCRFFKPL